MEETSSSALDGEITGIRFGLASRKEVCAASVGDCSITHAIQLSNPFLGLPLESGRCESCGTSDPDKCEGHFGYIELPIPIFHPSHVGELKRMLSLLCFKCLKMRNNKFPIKNVGVGEQLLASCCADAAQVSIRDVKTSEGAHCLQLRRSKLRSADGFLRSPDGFWNFLERYGFRYGDNLSRPLLPCEVMEILKRLPEETKRKLVGKGYFPQDGYIIQYLPVPPNCLSVPDISDGVTVMSSDLSVSMLRKVLRQVEIIKNSRSGTPNFESHDIEAQDLQVVVNEYLQVRGTAKASRDVDARFGIRKEQSDSATKAWLEKMRTLFIRKGSGFSSRSVITGDAYKKVSEIGIPSEIAQRITFEEKVSIHNIIYLQNLVDKKLCLAYRDGAATYSLREGSKGHTSLRPGQVVHRRIVDGDVVFINRPPTTHKHSLQALSVYIHEDHTVKINPLICGPLGADFDGDCVHLFYPQSLSAKAEVLELFSVDKQLLSSHSGNLNLQLATDSLLSLKVMFRKYFYDKLGVQQLAMYASSNLPQPALLKAHRLCKTWTALQILETALPAGFDCCGDRYLIKKSEILDVDYSKDFIASMINEVVSSIFFEKNAKEVLKFFDALQPLLMENIFVEGFSVCLEDFYISQSMIRDIHKSLQSISPLLLHLRTTDNELLQLQLENHIRFVKLPVSQFILKSSALGDLVDSKSDSAINKVVQQIGFLGVQISNKGKFYSESLFDEMASLFHRKYSYAGVHYPSGEYGLIKSSFIGGLDPYEMMVHSISTREVIVRSTRGLSEPGTLFKNLMAILRDVTICYDGTVRNVCSNSIIQFEYGFGRRGKDDNLFPPGEPVGVLAATAMSNPAYKAVLDSSPSSNSSWELMKEILQCRVNYKNEAIDRRVILYLNRCGCGRKHCNENAACLVKSHLKKVSLKDIAVNFMIEYKDLGMVLGGSEHHAGLVGHVHLNQALLKDLNITMSDVLQRCQTTINLNRKKKKNGKIFKATVVSVSEGCTFQPLSAHKRSQMPCLMFSCLDAYDIELEKVRHVLADIIFPVLVETIIKGDPRICSANIVWINPPTTSWMRSSRRNCKGELALDIVLDKSVCKRSGDAWRIVVDSCLPILHLIDTRRSVPYAIKQVEELLGISCAFDQAAQRLSSSVTAVAKGVLKEHLILLADSMTCSGNLIGFNSAGYKAFSRSLNIQVPFTEATLVTPRKCFERASVKCHMDSLSSIVTSCSWGKRVAVGTGSRFDLLWGTKEVDLRHNGVTTDLYSFLHMVRGPNAEAEGGTACLGAEVDHLDWEVESTDLNLSPQNDHNSDRPVFEDIIDHNSDGWVASAWGKSGDGSENGNAWKTNSETQEKQSQWEQQTLGSVAKGWGRKAEDADRARSGWEDSQLAEAKDLGKKEEDSDTRGSGWEGSTHVEATTWAKKADVDMLGSGWNNSKTEEKQSQWEQQTTGGEAKGWGRKAEDSDMAGGGWEGSKLAEAKGWGKKAGDNDTHGRGWTGSNHVEATTWAKKADANTLGGGWNSSEHSEVTGWGKKAKDDDVHGSGWNGTQRTEATGWGQKAEGDDMHGSGWIGAQRAEAKGWGKKAGDSDTHGSGWKGSDRVEATTWAEKADSDMRGSGWNSSEHTETISWGKKEDDDAHVSGWNSTQRAEAAGWGKKAEDNTHGSEWNGTPGWRKKAEDGDTPVSGRNASQNAEEMELGKKAEDGEMPGSGWKSSQHTESTGWSEKAVDVGTPGRGWNGSQVAGVQQSNDPNPWRSDSRKKGKGTNSEWRSRRSLSRPRELANDDSNSARMFTLTRQRLDMFTSEEQDMLVEVEGIMQSIRRIMHQSGYNDNDPLSAEDQSYIIDNVLNHHPDKAAKMGAGIEHITVSKHGSFQDSRCFFVVSTDGGRVDFSYRKCLENYIRAKYPDAADPFIGKYFRRPRSEGKREQSVAPGTPAPGESGTENSENR